MKLERITFNPVCDLTFTKEEVELLMRLSAMHYDAHCREVGKVGGFLFGMNNRYVLEVPEVVALGDEMTLAFRDIDTLCKILESAIYERPISTGREGLSLELAEDLADGLRDCLNRLNAVAGLQQEIR